jgi:hypothetical protein
MSSSVRALSLLVALCVAPSLRAGDPLASDFKQQAGQHAAAIKEAAKDAVKSIKASLAPTGKSFGTGQVSLQAALATAVVAITQGRDELEDTVFSHLATLAHEGHQILVAAGSPTPGPDFGAGSGGTWDEALSGAQEVLDEADDDMRAALTTFVKALAKSGKKQKLAVDVRAQLPPHGEAYWSLVPPAAIVDPPADGQLVAPVQPPQLLVAMRGVVTGSPDSLRLGLRANAASVDVRASSTSGEELPLASLETGISGTAVADLPLDTLAHPEGYVVVHLRDGTQSSARVAVSAPSLLVPDPGAEPPLQAFKQSLKESRKELAKATSEALQELKDGLGQEADLLDSGAKSAEAALGDGFARLRSAREAVGLAWKVFVSNTAAAASLALAGAGVEDSGLPSDFQPDVSGLAATSYKGALKQVDSRQAQITKACESFVGKLVKAAAKQDVVLNASRVLGRTGTFAAPMVSGAPSPPNVPSSSPRLPDGMVIALPAFVTDLDGPLDLTLLFDLQADFGQLPTLPASVISLPDGSVTGFEDIPLGPGGTQLKELLLSPDFSLGWALHTGPTPTDTSDGMVLTPPKLEEKK